MSKPNLKLAPPSPVPPISTLKKIMPLPECEPGHKWEELPSVRPFWAVCYCDKCQIYLVWCQNDMALCWQWLGPDSYDKFRKQYGDAV